MDKSYHITSNYSNFNLVVSIVELVQSNQLEKSQKQDTSNNGLQI